MSISRSIDCIECEWGDADGGGSGDDANNTAGAGPATKAVASVAVGPGERDVREVLSCLGLVIPSLAAEAATPSHRSHHTLTVSAAPAVMSPSTPRASHSSTHCSRTSFQNRACQSANWPRHAVKPRSRSVI